MGIIGGVLGLPASICSSACAGCVGTIADLAEETTTQGSEAATFYLALGIIGAIAGLIGGVLGKRLPNISGIMMLISAVMVGITGFVGNLLAWVVAILFLIGGAFCLAQKKEVIE